MIFDGSWKSSPFWMFQPVSCDFFVHSMPFPNGDVDGISWGPSICLSPSLSPRNCELVMFMAGRWVINWGNAMVLGCTIFGKMENPNFWAGAVKKNPVTQQTHFFFQLQRKDVQPGQNGKRLSWPPDLYQRAVHGKIVRQETRSPCQNRLRTGKACFAVPTSFNSSVVELAQNHLSF